MRPLLFGDCWVLSLSVWGHRAIYGFCFKKRAGGPLQGTFTLALSMPAGSHTLDPPFLGAGIPAHLTPPLK